MTDVSVSSSLAVDYSAEDVGDASTSKSGSAVTIKGPEASPAFDDDGSSSTSSEDECVKEDVDSNDSFFVVTALGGMGPRAGGSLQSAVSLTSLLAKEIEGEDEGAAEEKEVKPPMITHPVDELDSDGWHSDDDDEPVRKQTVFIENGVCQGGRDEECQHEILEVNCACHEKKTTLICRWCYLIFCSKPCFSQAKKTQTGPGKRNTTGKSRFHGDKYGIPRKTQPFRKWDNGRQLDGKSGFENHDLKNGPTDVPNHDDAKPKVPSESSSSQNVSGVPNSMVPTQALKSGFHSRFKNKSRGTPISKGQPTPPQPENQEPKFFTRVRKFKDTPNPEVATVQPSCNPQVATVQPSSMQERKSSTSEMSQVSTKEETKSQPTSININDKPPPDSGSGANVTPAEPGNIIDSKSNPLPKSVQDHNNLTTDGREVNSDVKNEGPVNKSKDKNITNIDMKNLNASVQEKEKLSSSTSTTSSSISSSTSNKDTSSLDGDKKISHASNTERQELKSEARVCIIDTDSASSSSGSKEEATLNTGSAPNKCVPSEHNNSGKPPVTGPHDDSVFDATVSPTKQRRPFSKSVRNHAGTHFQPHPSHSKRDDNFEGGSIFSKRNWRQRPSSTSTRSSESESSQNAPTITSTNQSDTSSTIANSDSQNVGVTKTGNHNQNRMPRNHPEVPYEIWFPALYRSGGHFSEFAVIPKWLLSKFEILHCKLQTCAKTKLTSYQEGGLCLVKYCHNRTEKSEEEWYRASIELEVKCPNSEDRKTKVVVTLIDYGIEQVVVDAEELYEVPSQLLDKPFALKVRCLNVRANHSDPEVIEHFQSLVRDREFKVKLQFTPKATQRFSCTLQVHYMEKWFDAGLLLKKLQVGEEATWEEIPKEETNNTAPKTNPKPDDYLPINKMIKIKITHVVSPNEFYVCEDTETSIRLKKKLQHDILKDGYNGPFSTQPLIKVMKNLKYPLYIWTDPDKQWPRVKALELIDSFTVLVQKIDTGEKVLVPLKELTALPKQYHIKPSGFAYKCSLPLKANNKKLFEDANIWLWNMGNIHYEYLNRSSPAKRVPDRREHCKVLTAKVLSVMVQPESNLHIVDLSEEGQTESMVATYNRMGLQLSHGITL